MLSLTALATVAIFAQEPAPAPAPDPAKVAFEKTLKKYHDSAAMHVNAEVKVFVNMALMGLEPKEGQSPMQEVAKLNTKLRWAKPNYGSIHTTGEFNYMGQTDKIEVETMGTKEGVYSVDHMEKAYDGPYGIAEVGEALVDFIPFSGFLNHAHNLPADIKQLAADEAHAGMIGWTWNSMQGEASLWMKGEIPISLDVAMKEGDQLMQKISLSFSGLELLEEAKADDYLTKLPEGYKPFEDTFGDAEFEEPDFEASLLAVGAEAPQVKFTDMDGKEVELSSLKGKTILMNFWFYH